MKEKKNINQLDFLFFNYLNLSEDLIEKKCKIIVLDLLLDHKNIYLSSMPVVNDIVYNISGQLQSKKYTTIPIYNYFEEQKNSNQEYVAFMHTLCNLNSTQSASQPIDLSTKILNWHDINYSEKEILKDIYEKFSFVGILAHNLINNSKHANFCAEIQDYKLTQQDIDIIKTFSDSYNLVNHYQPANCDYEIWKNIIEKEDNIDNVKILESFFITQKMIQLSYKGLIGPIDSAIDKCLVKKLSYLKLKNELGEEPQKEVKTKRPKI